MRIKRFSSLKKRMAGLLLAGATLYGPLGSCSLDDVTTTTTTTLDGSVVLISLLRSLLITPLDQALTTGIENLVDNLSDDE